MAGMDRTDREQEACGRSDGAVRRKGYRMVTAADISRLLQASKSLVRRMAKAGTLPAPLALGSGCKQPGQVQRWRPEEVAEALGITVADVLSSIEEQEVNQ